MCMRCYNYFIYEMYKMVCTFVSAFISNANNNKNIEKYIEYVNKLIHISVKKIIFLEQNIYNEYFENKDINDEFTKFIIFDKKDMYLYEYLDKIDNFDLITDNKNKDTIEYIFVQCYKTEWIKKAMEYDNDNNNNYVWIDFGIYHIINDDNKFINVITEISKKTYNNVRIASCWNINDKYDIDIYRQIAWYFCGGIFGGSKMYLELFANVMKNMCISIIEEKKTIMWEVNIWYMIYVKFPFLFDIYYANHDIRMLSLY